MKKVKIYTTKNCKYCKDAKEYFDKHNISYTTIDVGENADKKKEMVELSGQMGVPVIAIDDYFIVGFNKVAINKVLDIKNEK